MVDFIPKKKFFSKPPIKEIRKRKKIDLAGASLEEVAAATDEYEPSTYFETGDLLEEATSETARHFMRHQRRMSLTSYKGMTDLQKVRELSDEGMIPLQLRERAYNGMTDPFHAGVTFDSPLSNDGPTRTYMIMDTMRGLEIVVYEDQSSAHISLDAMYWHPDSLGKQGLNVHVSVPSEQQKFPRYKFVIRHLPAFDKRKSFYVAMTTRVDGQRRCEDAVYRDETHRTPERYPELGSPDVNVFCKHVFAGLYKVMSEGEAENGFKLDDEQKLAVLKFSHAHWPTERAVRNYIVRSNRLLIRRDGQVSRARKVDMEILANQDIINARNGGGSAYRKFFYAPTRAEAVEQGMDFKKIKDYPAWTKEFLD